MKLWLLTILVFLVSFLLIGLLGMISAIIIAGPHSDILPSFLQIPTLIIIGIIILTVPFWVAYRVFKILSKNKMN